MLAAVARAAAAALVGRSRWTPACAATRRSAGGDAIDWSRFPRLAEDELEERFVRGSGPGGQSVNKTANCVSLKHVPSGLVVKCHESRSLETNRRRARELLAAQLDRTLHGEQSVAAQQERIRARRQERRDGQRRRRHQRKQQWRERESPPDP